MLGKPAVQLSVNDLLSLCSSTSSRQTINTRKKILLLLKEFSSLQSNLDAQLMGENGYITGIKLQKRRLQFV